MVMRLSHFFLTAFWLVLPVSANTEIANIEASEHLSTLFASKISHSWPALDPSLNERRWEVLPAPLHTPPTLVCRDNLWHDCPHDLWLVFNLDHPQWTRFSKFTFRISWPASSPTDFHIHIYTPSQIERLLDTSTNVTSIPPNTRTRNLYAKIRLIDTGVPTPSSHPPPIQTVAFLAILEPLYFGLIPQSLVPTVLFLIPVILLSGFFVFPKILAYLEGVVEVARKEVGARRE